MDLYGYLAWRGDLTFAERPLNDADALVLSTLSYLDARGLAGPGEEVPLPELLRRYNAAGRDQSGQMTDPRRLLAAAARTARFAPVTARDAVDDTDPARGIQFAAVTFGLPGLGFVAFRGTDATLVGWREDLTLACEERTPAQEAAAAYLDRALAASEGPLALGGHSKGGNLAIYAAAFCRSDTGGRLTRVWSFDGPGFNEQLIRREALTAAAPLVRHILPEGSVVGLLMTTPGETVFIRSGGQGLGQHSPYVWETAPDGFVPAAGQTSQGVFVDRTASRWLAGLSAQERRSLVDALFDPLDATGAVRFSDMGGSNAPASAAAILRGLGKIDSGQFQDVLGALGKLARAGGSALMDHLTGLGRPAQDGAELPPGKGETTR